jgi:hypothetical protein
MLDNKTHINIKFRYWLGVMLIKTFKTYDLNLATHPRSIEAWLFCEASISNDDILYRVRILITKTSEVILECWHDDKGHSSSLVISNETIEEALDNLATLPQHLVDDRLYQKTLDLVMQQAMFE